MRIFPAVNPIGWALLAGLMVPTVCRGDCVNLDPLSVQGGSFTFSVMGDYPLGDNEQTGLPGVIDDLNAHRNSAFLLHLGNIKACQPCTEALFQNISSVLRRTKFPVFIVPGDNEWNDCRWSNPSGPGPDQALHYWDTYFGDLSSHWNPVGLVEMSPSTPRDSAFVFKGVLFVGVNLPSGRHGVYPDAATWNARLQSRAQWATNQLLCKKDLVRGAVVYAHAAPSSKRDPNAIFFTTLESASLQFEKPILLLNSDKQQFEDVYPWRNHANVRRVALDRGSIAPPLKVTAVSGDLSDPRELFVIDRFPPPDDPVKDGTNPPQPPSAQAIQTEANLSNGETITLGYTLAQPEHVTVTLYDRRGTNIRTLVDADRSSGPQSEVWDGRDRHGELVSSGFYVALIQFGGEKIKQKILVIR